MHKKVVELFGRVEKVENRGDDKLRLDLHGEAFALTKLIRRLGEDVEQTDLDQMKRGESTNKTLIGVDLGCTALDFNLKAITGFLTSDDPSFYSARS
jgi:hypothetical protein